MVDLSIVMLVYRRVPYLEEYLGGPPIGTLLATARAQDRIWLDESCEMSTDSTQYSVDKPIDLGK